jgi:hypothetical protein
MTCWPVSESSFLIGPVQATDDVEQYRLVRPGSPDQRHHLAAVEGQRDAATSRLVLLLDRSDAVAPHPT